MARNDDGRAGVLGCAEVRDRLYPLLLRTLSEPQRTDILEHIAGCEACRITLQAVRGRLQRIEGVALPDLDDRRRELARRRRRLWLMVLPALPALVAWAVLLHQGIAIARLRSEQQFLIRLQNALLVYQDDHGAFPPDDGAPLGVYLTAPDPRGRPYLSAPAERLSAAGRFVDAWGNPWRYRAPGMHNPRLFDLQSLGANGRDDDGGRDDLANWVR